MNVLKRLVYVLLMIPVCTIVFVIESLLLPLIIPAIWVITGSTILQAKELNVRELSMTKEETAKCIKVMQAYANGEIIEEKIFSFDHTE